MKKLLVTLMLSTVLFVSGCINPIAIPVAALIFSPLVNDPNLPKETTGGAKLINPDGTIVDTKLVDEKLAKIS